MPDLDPVKHEDSYPFLSGDTLRAFADIIFERDTTYLYFATKNKWTVFPKDNRQSQLIMPMFTYV